MITKKSKSETKKVKEEPKVLGRSSKFQLLINPDRDPNLMKEAAVSNNYKKFFSYLPEELKPASGAIYNFYRAKHALDLREDITEDNDLRYHKLLAITRQKIKEQCGNLFEAAYSSTKKRTLVRTASGKYVWRDHETNRKLVGKTEERKTKKQPYKRVRKLMPIHRKKRTS